MITNDVSTCPKCGGDLKYYDRVTRIVRTKGRKTWKIPMRRLQCTRCGSVHRELPELIFPYKQYSDVNRVQLINKESPDIPFRNGFGTRLIDKMYPITLPYFPADKKFKIIVEEFLTDEKNGDFDTVGYLQLILPNGEVVDLNGYFKDGPDGMVRIEQAEYEERKANRIDKK